MSSILTFWSFSSFCKFMTILSALSLLWYFLKSFLSKMVGNYLLLLVAVEGLSSLLLWIFFDGNLTLNFPFIFLNRLKIKFPFSFLLNFLFPILCCLLLSLLALWTCFYCLHLFFCLYQRLSSSFLLCLVGLTYTIKPYLHGSAFRTHSDLANSW